ncbi:acyltransferase family protein [Pedobacter nanyangensis]|uniref:acyltransferase family protein n=1 Tax=Pedobacter nanyangensis TaxID=1562389 RepID=UPI000DE530E0
MSELPNRIRVLDSFRAIAALGVLWIHIWTIHGQPKVYFHNMDILMPINIVGNGVDLFFVISGFCMYYFYAKSSSFSSNNFFGFLVKRWQRLSPVFYFCTLVYILIFSHSSGLQNILKFLTSVFYLNSISPYNAEGFMWSLGTEWQFYLIIPILLIYQNKLGFNRTISLITIIFLLISIVSVLILGSKSDFLTDQIIFRYFEFLWGIIIGRLFLLGYVPKLNANLLVVVFAIMAYTGRFFLTDSILQHGGAYRNLIKIVGYNLMSMGFAGLIYICLTLNNFLKKLVDNKLFSFIGKISYSFYLWHGLVHIIIGNYLIKNLSKHGDFKLAIINFIVSSILLIPISYASYYIFEVRAYHLLQKRNK